PPNSNPPNSNPPNSNPPNSNPGIIEASRVLVGTDGVVLGTALIGVTVVTVINVLSALPLGPNGRIWLADGDGRIVATVPPEPSSVAAPHMAPGMTSPSMILIPTNQGGGPGRLMALRPVAGSSLMIAVGMSLDAVLAPWWENLFWYGLAALVLGLLALVYAWLLELQTRSAAAAWSEQQVADAALRASQERNAAILAAAADGILAINPCGRMETVNAAAARIFGYQPKEMLGRNITMLMPALSRCGHERMLAVYHNNGAVGVLESKREVLGLRSDGSEFPLEIAVSKLDQSGEPLLIAVLADITERKETELALRSAKLDAEAANQAKSQFLAHMSHELRTPLNAIIGFSDMMMHEMMGGLSPVYLDYARNINDSGRQLISIIDDLLDVSRLQLGKFTLTEGEVDLRSAVVGAFAMVRPRAEDSGIIFAEAVPESLPKLHGDSRAIRQIVINLVSNAVKFTPRGGTVQVSVEDSPDGRLLLVVADTGCGIPPELIDRVLDPFHHADAFKASKTRGIGLGLPICRWLMELHGGSLTIKSSHPAGTTVVADFPKERVLRAEPIPCGM
ncbi:MAG: ATP-binding protein, partial [Rhodospirillaceae bacterium]